MSEHKDDIPAIKSALIRNLSALVETLFHNRQVTRRGHEYRIGKKGSLSVQKDGTWYDHEAGAGGDVIDLLQHILATDFKGALAWAKTYIGRGSGSAQIKPMPNLKEARAKSRTKQSARAKALWIAAHAPLKEAGGNHADS